MFIPLLGDNYICNRVHLYYSTFPKYTGDIYFQNKKWINIYQVMCTTSRGHKLCDVSDTVYLTLHHNHVLLHTLMYNRF